MNFMESVRHFTFLLSKKNLRFVNGEKAQDRETIASKVEGFSKTIHKALAAYAPVASSPRKNSSTLTADAATAMFQESNNKSEDASRRMVPISSKDRDEVIDQATRCLAWAHDPARLPVPGAESMTNDQVC